MDGFLTVKETVEKYVDGCQAKVDLSHGKLLGKAVFAGAMIALGAAGSNVAAHSISDVGLARMAAGAVFPMGLMMVILLGAELFTGDCMMGIGACAKKQSWADVVRVLVEVFLGNFVGGAFVAVLCYLSGQMNYTNGLLGAYTIKVALGKVNLSFGQALCSGILCNILVCAAVLMALSAKDISGKLLASFFMIFLFVVSGYEHCVANMYYITAGLIAKCNDGYLATAMSTYGYTAEQLDVLNVGNFLVKNLLPVTIGNILGGMVFLGIPLYFLNREKK